eukprot:1193768-Prorocentrum_minimum.AAC.6
MAAASEVMHADSTAYIRVYLRQITESEIVFAVSQVVPAGRSAARNVDRGGVGVAEPLQESARLRRGERAVPLYTHSRHQSQKGRENIPISGTNRRRGERICPQQAPITEGKREYTHNRHQSQKGRENIPLLASASSSPPR